MRNRGTRFEQFLIAWTEPLDIHTGLCQDVSVLDTWVVRNIHVIFNASRTLSQGLVQPEIVVQSV